MFHRATSVTGAPRRNAYQINSKPNQKKTGQLRMFRGNQPQFTPIRSTSQPTKKLTIDHILFPHADQGFPPIHGDSSTPEGIEGRHGLYVEYPVNGIFYMDGDVLRFQKTLELRMASLEHLINLRAMSLLNPASGSYSLVIANEIRNKGLNPDAPDMLKSVKEEGW